MKSRFYRICNSVFCMMGVPAIIIGILFIAAFALCGSDDRAVAIVMFVAIGVFAFVFAPLALLCMWFRRKPEAEKEALMKGTEKAKPVKDKAVKPVQVSRTKTHGSADSGNYSIDAMQASYSVQTDPAKGEQTATLAAQRCKTKTRTRSRNLSHKHTGKTSSRSITVTAETCRTTITVQRVIVTAKTQKAPAKATAPRRVSASKSARLLPAVDEDAYDGLQSRG